MLRAGSHARVVRGSLTGWDRKEPSPGLPNADVCPRDGMATLRGIRTAKIVCHAVCPNSRLNARFEWVGCLHMASRVNGGQSLDFRELVGSCMRVCDIGSPTYKQEVRGSSPRPPTITINNLQTPDTKTAHPFQG